MKFLSIFVFIIARAKKNGDEKESLGQIEGGLLLYAFGNIEETKIEKPLPNSSGPETASHDALFKFMSSRLTCMTCSSRNYNECSSEGFAQECQENEQSCQIEIRKRGPKVESVKMGCKALDACLANKSQNFRGRFAEHQCKPRKWQKATSVCRQCCDSGKNCFGDNEESFKLGAEDERREKWEKDFTTEKNAFLFEK
ncbi:Oidioi.mRNA.OKI2018_I69.chr2.g5081.t1.cds [Oikopleura dioica]|uniref:Oidioi.mRNA.OKI2018_I69.chr2.g5081.t1.cds n=1 Tax=Oikopleura dioica TaxID=34765 RepID=A0ABN7SYX0_OIKDI|nr:Oidioi.mRNA.OKI2018_I69.chr2.g5081.t1.cds [Oikopleura dioica]